MRLDAGGRYTPQLSFCTRIRFVRISFFLFVNLTLRRSSPNAVSTLVKSTKTASTNPSESHESNAIGIDSQAVH